jgi:type I restriction enzyme S subunit
LGFVANVILSNVDKHTIEGELPVRLCNYTDVYKNDRITSAIEFMQASALPREIEKFHIRKDDVLVTKDSEDPNDIAVSALIAEDLPGVLCGYHLAMLRPDQKQLCGPFLAWLQASKQIRAQYEAQATGVTRFALGQSNFKEVVVPLPLVSEQRQIAAYLDEQTAKIDQLMDMRRRQMALLKEQRAALIQEAVTRGLNPNTPMKDSGLPWLGEIPAHWEVKRLKYLCSLLRDGTHQPPKRVEVGYPLLSVRNIQEGIFARREDDSMISEEDFKTLNRSLVVKAGDLLMAIVGATLGKVAVVPEMDQFQIQRSLAIMRPRLEIVHKEFLCFLIECQALQKCLWSNVGFSAQPGIYLSTLGGLGFPLPSLKEQTQILEFIQYECQRIDALHAAYTRQLTLLTEYRAALIHECVTGQRTVPEINYA